MSHTRIHIYIYIYIYMYIYTHIYYTYLAERGTLQTTEDITFRILHYAYIQKELKNHCNVWPGYLARTWSRNSESTMFKWFSSWDCYVNVEFSSNLSVYSVCWVTVNLSKLWTSSAWGWAQVPNFGCSLSYTIGMEQNPDQSETQETRGLSEMKACKDL
jgi:hypothetical protein